MYNDCILTVVMLIVIIYSLVNICKLQQQNDLFFQIKVVQMWTLFDLFTRACHHPGILLLCLLAFPSTFLASCEQFFQLLTVISADNFYFFAF